MILFGCFKERSEKLFKNVPVVILIEKRLIIIGNEYCFF